MEIIQRKLDTIAPYFNNPRQNDAGINVVAESLKEFGWRQPIVVDQEGKQQRGLLGWRELTAFPDEAKKQLIDMKKGDITQPVQTKNGIQIFRIEAKGDGASKAELEQMRVELTELLKFQATQKIKKTLKIEKLYPPKKPG